MPEQPKPVFKGEPVTEHLIAWLRDPEKQRNVCIPQDAAEKTVELVKARSAVGMRKYGQPLMTEDGRDTFQDALEEVGDLIQYTFKAKMKGQLRELYPRLEPYLVALQMLLISEFTMEELLAYGKVVTDQRLAPDAGRGPSVED